MVAKVANEIHASAFALRDFERALVDASRGKEAPCAQIKYLTRYCAWLGALTVVREEHYVDRHFVDEHGLYYSRMLQPPPNAVRRFHLFRRSFTNVDLARIFERRARLRGEKLDAYDTRLSLDYLGFISVRPLPSAPIGRTVLRRLPDGDEPREIWATERYGVHLGNLRLWVEGIAFQQQDVAVGACATAAAWTALSRVTKHEGMRAPTPAEVSEAAGRHLLTHGRTLPAVAGLTIEQLSEAIRSIGFAPESIRADLKPEYFAIALHTYLQSGIPVVLSLVTKDEETNDDERHAVTAVGFQMAEAPNPRLDSTLPVRSARMKKLYVHDDALGPYARASLRPMPTNHPKVEKEQRMNEENSAPELPDFVLLDIETSRPDDQSDGSPGPEETDQWLVECGLAPVYPKLRLSVRCLIKLGNALVTSVERIVGPKVAPRLSVDFYYRRSGTYLGSLRSGRKGGLDTFLRTVALSRWCGVVRWFVGDRPLAEFVYDTTDIVRATDLPGAELLRAIVTL